MRAGIAAVVGLTAAQAGLFALHLLAPDGGTTMIRRFFPWQVLNLFERPPNAVPLGVVAVTAIAALVVRGRFGLPASSAICWLLALLAIALAGRGVATSLAGALD